VTDAHGLLRTVRRADRTGEETTCACRVTTADGAAPATVTVCPAGESRLLSVVRAGAGADGRRRADVEALTTRLELALAETDTGVWAWDLDTGEVVCDETTERLFGFDAGVTPEEYDAIRERIHPEDREGVERSVETALTRGQQYRAEFRVRHDDQTRWMQSRGVVRDGDDGTRIVGVQTEITERKRAERELRRRTQRLELLHRIVRHDIRNDMEVVLSCARLLRETVDAPGAADRVDELVSASEHVVELTEVVRDLVRTLEDSDAVEPVALAPVLEDELDTLRATECVSVETPETFPSVRVLADDMLGTVFRNVLSNAVRHSDREVPTVSVAVAPGEETVVVRVADDGPGVPESRREEVFARGEMGLESPGSGLGLYLVDELVDGYGGEVWVEDNDPRGAVFAVSLRRAVD
jgi:PAS domain S-box-containing protein